MEDKNCGTEKTEDSPIRQDHEPRIEKEVPSSITVSVPARREFEEVYERRVIPKGLLALLISMGLVLIAGVITVAVLLITQPNARAAVGPAPSAVQTAEPSLAQEPTPLETPVPTTEPEPSDDYSAIFDAPQNEILDSQGQ